MYRCKNNPEHKRFGATAVEHTHWIVDEDGNYIESGECYDAKLIEVTDCAECDGEVEEVEEVEEEVEE